MQTADYKLLQNCWRTCQPGIPRYPVTSKMPKLRGSQEESRMESVKHGSTQSSMLRSTASAHACWTGKRFPRASANCTLDCGFSWLLSEAMLEVVAQDILVFFGLAFGVLCGLRVWSLWSLWSACLQFLAAMDVGAGSDNKRDICSIFCSSGSSASIL